MMKKTMKSILVGMSAFARGFKKGAKETPRMYFAPAIAVWILLVNTTNSLAEGTHK